LVGSGGGVAIEDAHYEALAAFRRALREFVAFSEAAAQTAGLTPQQHQAILAIRARRMPTSIGDLADDLAIRPNSAHDLVGRLVKSDLVDRAVAADDHRRIDLRLTAKAEAILASLSVAHLDELRRRKPLLTALLGRLDP
jgi:DNA-binding MarR family transcriptional regulator